MSGWMDGEIHEQIVKDLVHRRMQWWMGEQGNEYMDSSGNYQCVRERPD